MAERKLIERLTDAVTQLREPLPVKMLGDIESKSSPPQDRPNFGQQGYYGSQYYDPLRFGGWNRSDAISYRHEVGDLRNASLVMAIVNWTGLNLAEALPVVTKPDKKGVPQIELQHEASDLVRRPNPFHIWADYCQAGAFDWWMGNWYMKKVRDLAGKVIELWYIPQFLIEPRWPFDGKSPEVPLSEVEGDPYQAFISHYQYNVPGKTPILIKKSEMIHIKRGVSSVNARKGEGVWDSVLEEIYGDGAVARFSATIMKNMGLNSYLLSPKEKDFSLGATEAAAIKEQWIRNSTGDNLNKPMVNAIPLDVTKLSSDPKELDLKELRNVPESRVAGVTGIPAIVLQFLVGLQNGHYGAAYEQARQQGYESVIIPIQNHISEDLTWQLLPELDKSPGARIGFDISKVRVLQEDRDNLYKREADALRSGGITVNQFLSSLGKDTVDGGDIYYVPRTSLPLTLETLKQIAADPAALQGAMPAEQALTNAIPPAKMIEQLADIDRTIAYLEEQMKEFGMEQG